VDPDSGDANIRSSSDSGGVIFKTVKQKQKQKTKKQQQLQKTKLTPPLCSYTPETKVVNVLCVENVLM